MTRGTPFIRFGREICCDLAQAERREWWLSNGLGAYAAGTVAGTLTRRYHGLLVAPVQPPLGRMLLAAKADATLCLGGRRVPLHTNRWAGGAVDPQGFLHLESFTLEGRRPVWRFAAGAAALEMRVWMEQGEHRTHVAYRLTGADEHAAVDIRLLANARDHHQSTWPGSLDPSVEAGERTLTARFAPDAALHVSITDGSLRPDLWWAENFDLPVERERGLPDRDAHLCVAHLTLDLEPDEWAGLSIGTTPADEPRIEAALERARSHEEGLLSVARRAQPSLDDAPGWVDQLVLSADSFLFARPLPQVPDGMSVIAGYPWFGDWGRDTMIALPGLTLACGRVGMARTILRTFARFVDRGMLPNVFPGAGDAAEYNTVDAALWYVEAWRAYVEASGDVAALAEAFPALASIIGAYRDGTRHGIALDPSDGLIRAGEAGVQLTWMDAKVGDWVVTPRIGKPVEINALWFSALAAMADFARLLGRNPEPYEGMVRRARDGFVRFVRADGQGLLDVLDGPLGDDATCRPNQILAVSLPNSPLQPDDQAHVVAAVGRDLLTTFGLRSLAPGDRDYRGRYEGGVLERDGSYHQGPVWAWLLGPYALAEYRVTGDASLAMSRLDGLGDHLADAGLGTVSEIFDGDEPHLPRGCPAQAWSVATALDAWLVLARALRSKATQGDSDERRTTAA